jgi:hypothetical protein
MFTNIILRYITSLLSSIKYNKKVKSLIFLLIILCFQSCKSPTAPKTTPLPETKDTTSHNWNFETFQITGAEGGIINDVVIVNDTLAYAGGEIDMYDSTGTFDYYSVAIWNGYKWEPKRLYDSNNNLIPILRGIFVIDASNIWLTDGGVYLWDGHSRQVSTSFDRISLIGGSENGQSVNKLWGTSSNNLYGVGWKGMITFYNGQTWQKIESGIDLQFNDIYGATNPNNGKQEILAVATQNYPSGIALFSIQGNTATKISTYPLISDQVELYSIWFVPDRHYYIVGNGIYEKNSLSDSTWKNGIFDITTAATTKVRGNALNDLFVVGVNGEFLHWNGASWKSYKNDIGLSSGTGYTSVAVKGNFVIAVGTNNGQPIITIGRR